ncbi:hypothetical protein H6P81_021085 [Aristolochia fimbriata]|uniref:Uncharacterized protein n=1 Tax=Aristolochia fimbriata TaxID=158543 RepID=A0AAV7DY10_ARIFI|nr:hypothetical protein H6P81_021085 [Aristolochia fimbriata]
MDRGCLIRVWGEVVGRGRRIPKTCEGMAGVQEGISTEVVLGDKIKGAYRSVATRLWRVRVKPRELSWGDAIGWRASYWRELGRRTRGVYGSEGGPRPGVRAGGRVFRVYWTGHVTFLAVSWKRCSFPRNPENDTGAHGPRAPIPSHVIGLGSLGSLGSAAASGEPRRSVRTESFRSSSSLVFDEMPR